MDKIIVEPAFPPTQYRIWPSDKFQASNSEGEIKGTVTLIQKKSALNFCRYSLWWTGTLDLFINVRTPGSLYTWWKKGNVDHSIHIYMNFLSTVHCRKIWKSCYFSLFFQEQSLWKFGIVVIFSLQI